MCDYSLHNCKTRDAKIEDLIVTGTIQTQLPYAAHTSSRGCYALGERDVAVCLKPGTELSFTAPIQYRERPTGWFQGETTVTSPHTTAIFRKLTEGMYHDAIELPDGTVVLVNKLMEDQQARVIQLPAEKLAEKLAEEEHV